MQERKQCKSSFGAHLVCRTGSGGGGVQVSSHVWNATVYHGDILQPLWPQLLSAPPPQLVLPRDCPGVRLGQCV